MQYSELREVLKTAVFEVKRVERDDFLEAVIVKSALDDLTAKLQSFFGEPVSSSGAALSPREQERVDSLGGIMPGQTLYLKQEQEMLVCAMLWPWQDGEHITLKLSGE
ncbi:MAG: hypothetical protein MJA29_10220 [Candidatus Omnitrophica bacterium]|nr:hypothetical protein [Candidatus Omnitrophota bacterium]